MTQILTNIKAYISTILGVVLIVLSILSYAFDFPKEHPYFIDLIVGSIGFLLVFTKPEDIASDLFEILKEKLSKK